MRPAVAVLARFLLVQEGKDEHDGDIGELIQAVREIFIPVLPLQLCQIGARDGHDRRQRKGKEQAENEHQHDGRGIYDAAHHFTGLLQEPAPLCGELIVVFLFHDKYYIGNRLLSK